MPKGVKISKFLTESRFLGSFIIRIKGFPLADKFVLADKLLFWLIKWDFVKTGRCERRWVGTPGRRCRCGGRRRREAPTTAGAAATAARRANPPLVTAPCFHRISFYSAKTKQFTQPKRSYSANGNPFMPMIWRFWANQALYKWHEIVYT